jgi:error-prone DNA polymerase
MTIQTRRARVLGRTLGVPALSGAGDGAGGGGGGFTPGEADQLRRAMASWKRKGDQIARFGGKLIDGMKARGHDTDFAQQVFEQIKGFLGYGFPESHAASFALLVYVSAY